MKRLNDHVVFPRVTAYTETKNFPMILIVDLYSQSAGTVTSISGNFHTTDDEGNAVLLLSEDHYSDITNLYTGNDSIPERVNLMQANTDPFLWFMYTIRVPNDVFVSRISFTAKKWLFFYYDNRVLSNMKAERLGGGEPYTSVTMETKDRKMVSS
jgi:hypothetical protein